MAHPPETKAAVRAAYIYQRTTIADAGAQHGVSETTVRQWMRAARAMGDDWDIARSAAGLSREGQAAIAQRVLEGFVLQFEHALSAIREAADLSALQRAEILTRLADSYSKTMAAAARTSTPISRLSVAMDTLRALSRWIADHRPDALESYADLLDAAGPAIAAEIGHG